MRFEIIPKLFVVFALLASATVAAAPISLTLPTEDAIGLHSSFLKEQEARLDLGNVVAAQKTGQFTLGKSPVLNFGIGSNPVWIHLAMDNPTGTPLHKRLSIETAWLDNVEVYFLHEGKTIATYRVGDDKAFSQRPVNNRFFVFDHIFNPGVSDVFIRIETADPMVVPLYLTDIEEASIRESRQELSYGIVYGFLLALMAYNAMLYASLRSSRYLLYSVYLAMFIVTNIAYTGHGFAWIWPTSVTWQLWSNPVLMFLYGASGLFFAFRFLDLREHFPRVYKAVAGYCLVFAGLLAAAVLSGNQQYALLVSFTFVFLFTTIMLLLGVISVYSGQKSAKYFLFAAFTAMAGAALTTLSVWGFIPYTSWTFRAVEMGMLVDATLLALALAHQFHVLQRAKIRAEQLAQFDPLTNLKNRRAFFDISEKLWSTALRKGRNVSVIMIDIDFFKKINDTHGHAHGDDVLVAAAATLIKTIRQGDVLARWGGEEFIVFLPETNIQEAVELAERLRTEIASIRIPHATGETAITVSFGVAQKEGHHLTLDSLISSADNYLYQAKQQGRNRVCYSPVGQNPGA